jgi:hypothetical protein
MTDLNARARKIFQILQLPSDYDLRNGVPKGAYESVLAELRSVVDSKECEADKNKAVWCQSCCYEAQQKAKSEAYAEAAKECEKWHNESRIALFQIFTADALAKAICAWQSRGFDDRENELYKTVSFCLAAYESARGR